ncbi:hypothetical protein NUACC21_36270 [Scytonema sp. NUACC21]
MTYLDKLSPWCLVRLQPNLQHQVLTRFRRRNDAEAHLQIMRRLIPGANFTIIFSPVLELQHQMPKTSKQ